MNTINLIKSDLYRNNSRKIHFHNFLKSILFNRSFKYCFWFRLSNANDIIVSTIASLMLTLISRKYGIQIPQKTKIGYGLLIGHPLCIIINETTKIGNNCTLAHFITIGSNHNKAAEIGNNVYIGPNVCIVENVKIGNNVTIGAGSVVTKDIPDNATVAGVPAKIISYKNPGRYAINKWEETQDHK